MLDSRLTTTPSSLTNLGIDKDGDTFRETCNYVTIMGMLMYLANNSRPDIAFVVHKGARFTHAPRHSYAMEIKRITRYLNGTKDKGMTITPTKNIWYIVMLTQILLAFLESNKTKNLSPLNLELDILLYLWKFPYNGYLNYKLRFL